MESEPPAPVPDESCHTPPGRMPLHTKILIGLVVGAALGLAANYYAGADATGEAKEQVKWVADNLAQPVGNIFLRLMFMVVVPLVVSALALAVVELGDLRQLGRVGLRTLLFTGIFSMSAVGIGVALVEVFEPGKTLSAEKRDELNARFKSDAAKKEADAAKSKTAAETIVDMLPENPLQEMVGAVDGTSPGNGMLAVMFFSLIFGVALNSVGEKGRTVVGFLEGTFAVAMAVIAFAMRLAPYGAGALVFSITATLGIDIVTTLLAFIATTIAGLAFQLIVVYSIVVWLFGRMRPWVFFKSVREAMLVAFGTSSSNASLPTAMRVARDCLKLPPKIANFVLTVGATGNQNGTALYEGVVVLFIAQVVGVDLSIAQQIQIVLMAVLAGIGTAGVPGGSIPLIVVLIKSVGMEGETIAIILGVDRLLDMCRTVVNVTGDLAVATCVARTGKEEPAEESIAQPASESAVVEELPVEDRGEPETV